MWPWQCREDYTPSYLIWDCKIPILNYRPCGVSGSVINLQTNKSERVSGEAGGVSGDGFEAGFGGIQ